MNLHIPKLPSGKKVYFASDFHLGAPDLSSSIQREKRLSQWLRQISQDAEALILVGDMFDFWFEYRKAVPKGHIRFLGQLAAMADRGIEIIVFVGNHDLWLGDYLQEQIGAKVIRQAQSIEIARKKFYIAHGDGLDPADRKFRFIKSIFTNPFCQWLFSWLHPDIGISLANWWSGSSRESKMGQHQDQHLVDHSNKIQVDTPHHYYIYGDCHVARTEPLDEESLYCNLGDWIKNDSYASFDGEELKLDFFRS